MRNCNTSKTAFLATLILLSLFGCGAPQKTNLSKFPDNIIEQSKQNDWKVVSDGLRYRKISVSVPDKNQNIQTKEFLLAQINPRKFLFKVYQNQNKPKSIKEIHQKTSSLLTFNGSFFDENFRALGLLISDGKKLHGFSRAKLLNGVFALDYNDKTRLYTPSVDLNQNSYSFAIQNGPVLIDEKGKIQILQETGQMASRTVLALDKEKNIVLLIIKQSLLHSENVISLYELANLLKEGSQFKEFGLRAVLNLDGGASTGAFIDGNYLPEISPVQNVITVFARQGA